MRRRRSLVCICVIALLAVAAAAQDDKDIQPESREALSSLKAVKRLCVEDFEGGANATQLRAMLIAEIHRVGRFVLTENPRNADAFLRGFAEDLVYAEQHSRDDNTNVRGSASVSTGGYTRNRTAASQSAGGSSSVRNRSTERRHEAALTVRIVNAEGDILWSASAESGGGKFRSASAEVTKKIADNLREETERGVADDIPKR